MLIFVPFETVSRLSYANRATQKSESESKRQKIVNMRSQGLIFRDLTKDRTAYKKFMKVKKREWFTLIY
jgi:hypothetical protein